MDNFTKKILNNLVMKYEESKSFTGANKVSQSFAACPEKLFPKYKDDSDFETFDLLNEAVRQMEEEQLVTAERERSGVIKRIRLNPENLDMIYKMLDRQPKLEKNEWFLHRMEEADVKNSSILNHYAMVQRERIRANKKIEFYEGEDKKAFNNLLKAISFVTENQTETFIRDASVKLYGDSKYLEKIQGKTQSFLYQFGEFEEKDTVFEECGMVKTPTYVMIKGNAVIRMAGQILDLSCLKGDIALSTVSIEEIEEICVLGSRIITIENMTTFHDYDNKDDFCIYLGGFHNKVKRDFLYRLYQMNETKTYLHFGDIDAGGFYIYEHLKEKTGIPFMLFNMDVSTLLRYKKDWKELTAHDRTRIKKLLQRYTDNSKENNSPETNTMKSGTITAEYGKVLHFMLEHNCKLEQEVLYVK